MSKESDIFLKKKSISIPLQLIKPIYNQIGFFLDGNKLSTYNIIDLSINLMKFIETFPELSGIEKKNIVLYVLNKFSNDYLNDGHNKTNIINFIEYILPSLIDSIISIDNKEIIINANKGFKKLFSCCKIKSTK